MLLCAAFAVADRWEWAKAARWGEDQAVPLRLAESLPWHPPSVGILNSRGDPNPNGLVWLAWPLSALSSFRMMAFAVALAQAGALVALAASMLPSGARWPALIALLSSAPLRFATEFWSQWLVVTLSAVALASLLAYRRSPQPYWFGGSVAAALGCGALYLPGVVTLLTFTALWISLLATRRSARWRPLLAIAGTLAFVAMAATFGPYLSAVDILALQPATPRGVFRRMVLSAYEALAGPIGAIRVAAGPPWMTTVATPGRDFADLGMTIALAGAAMWVQVGVTTAMYAYVLPVVAAALTSVAAWRRVPTVRPVLAWLWGCAVAHGVWIITVMLLTNVDFRWQIRTSLDRLEFQHSFIWPMATIVSAAALLRASAEKLPGAATD